MKIIVLGALSEIAEAACRELVSRDASFLLVGRNAVNLTAVADHLRVLGAASVQSEAADLAALDPEAALARWDQMLGGVDAIILAYGQLGDQQHLAQNMDATRALIDVNYGSAAGWCLSAANLFENRDHGALVVIGSVAGDRGRQSNFIYGSTKAALAALMAGLAHRLAPTGARAVLIKPGQVATAMTAHMERKGLLWSTPAVVGKAVARAVRQPTRAVVYTPSYWRWIMLVIKSVPNLIFHRTKL
jgi:decaprenylphospho-beta-D-erythro-pentofuranosid-2-ulose 2-reductase